jgi:hypothetical protein
VADLAHASEGDTDLAGDRAASHWAERFASRFTVKRLADIGNRGIHEPLDTEGLMLTWFASAIETGSMAAEEKLRKAQANVGHALAWEGRAGNWDLSPYMRGLELAAAILEGRAPVYRDRPPEGYREEVSGEPG